MRLLVTFITGMLLALLIMLTIPVDRFSLTLPVLSFLLADKLIAVLRGA